jgi:hypothetical protein
MNIANALVSGGIGLGSSAVMVAVVQGFFNRGQQRDQKELDDHRIWYEESTASYERVKAEAEEAKAAAAEAKAEAKADVAEAKKDCRDCMTQLREMRRVIYALCDELDDQIIPALTLPHADINEIRIAARRAVQRTRDAI